MQPFEEIVARQRAFFEHGGTRELGFRAGRLSALHRALLEHREPLERALWSDLHKGPFEAHVSEIGLALAEIARLAKTLSGLARPRPAAVPLFLFPSRAFIAREPHGVCLIISPWNYPLQLAVIPLAAAVAAGNTAVLKLSDRCPETSSVLYDIVRNVFDKRHVAPVIADPERSSTLLELPFDMFFFTGSRGVGKLIYRAAAEKMIPAVLELGGKNPCIVLEDVALRTTAERIVWGKCFNAGQTCIAPDYLLVHERVLSALSAEMRAAVTRFYGPDPKRSSDYCRLIDARHTERVAAMLGDRRSEVEIDVDERYIAPAFLEGISFDHPLMADEIFGPVLPMIRFSKAEEIPSLVRRFPDPLAAYVFSRNRRAARNLFLKLPCGGGCINDTLVHFSAPALPFGGVRASGIGRYHGDAGFFAFSRPQAAVVTPTSFTVPFRCPPYSTWGLRLLKKIMG